MTIKSKRIVGWLVGVFVIFPLTISILVTVLAPSGETRSSSSISTDQGVLSASQACVKASSKDIKNLSEGLINNTLSLINAFKSEFSQEDVDQIKAVFPSYVNPRVVAAQIGGLGQEPNVALWGIQEYDYGWRILALNGTAKQYSNHGRDIENDSASGRVRGKILELSANTNVEQCTKSKQ